MRIDLHTHSHRSDGTDSPRELVHRAAAEGLDVVALTDHDTAVGWAEASRAADEAGVRLVRGMEISCRFHGSGVHLLAYWPDPDHLPLLRLLADVLEGRDQRMPRIVGRLRELGHDITEADVLEQAEEATSLGRPHVADALVRKGIVGTRDQAFDELLSPGRPAYVSRNAADLEQAVRTVADAGGVSVVAHPWGRSSASVMQAEDLAGLRRLGLTGIEVDHQDHTPEQRTVLRAMAADLDLVATGSSDYHGTGKVDHDLGCNTTAVEEYERLVAAGLQATADAGRGLAG